MVPADPASVGPAAPIDPAAGGEPAADPDPAALRTAVPEAPEGYKVNLTDEARAALGMTDNDPMVSELAKFAHANGKPQGWVDDALEAAAALASAGVFDAGFDPAAEVAKLGENGPARQREVETFAEALKMRGEITDEEFGALMSLVPEAAGTTLLEKLRKMMGANGAVPAPNGTQTDPTEAAKEEARALARDPRYETDRAFRAMADEKFKLAFANG